MWKIIYSFLIMLICLMPLPVHAENRKAAENDQLILYYNNDSGQIGLKNKASHYIWWSSPPDADQLEDAKPLTITELQSSNLLTYADRNKQSTAVLRSGNAAEISYQKIDQGVKMIYEYTACGISIPVSYQLEENYMSVTVNCNEIIENQAENGLLAAQLTLLGSFGAARAEETGYFVIPDGCGTLIRFHQQKKNVKNYSQKVYGRDITNIPMSKPAVTEEIYMPVFGIVKDGNGMTVIIEKGDGNAILNAQVSDFDTCSFSFQLRGSDLYSMPGTAGNLTVFESGSMETEEIKLRYYPIADEIINYADIAETYRNYLLLDGGLSKKTHVDDMQLYLELYGGTMKTQSVLGIPVSMKTSITSYEEAQRIVSALYNNDVNHISVIYHNWTDAGISGKADYKAKPSGTLGGNSSFRKLMHYFGSRAIDFYPAVNNQVFASGNGYYHFRDTAIRISGSYSQQMGYSLPYGIPDTQADTKALLSPGVFTKLYSNLAEDYAEKSLKGVSLGNLTSVLWGDYGKQKISRNDAMKALQDSYQSLQNANLSIMADCCAAYAFPYVDKITGVPLHASGFDICDEEIPFYQLVLHGILPYACTPINATADSIETFLTAIATGCCPAYDMIYTEASNLKDTEFDQYYYAYYAFWTDTAVQEYHIADIVLSGVSDKIMIDYTREGDISITTYEDGTQIKINYAEKSITAGGMVYQLKNAEEGE